jgi:hypothetical protein
MHVLVQTGSVFLKITCRAKEMKQKEKFEIRIYHSEQQPKIRNCILNIISSVSMKAIGI